jgi:hypothetical protein
MGMPFQQPPLFRNWYCLSKMIDDRLGASLRLGRINTSSKSSLTSSSIRIDLIPVSGVTDGLLTREVDTSREF